MGEQPAKALTVCSSSRTKSPGQTCCTSGSTHVPPKASDMYRPSTAQVPPMYRPCTAHVPPKPRPCIRHTCPALAPGSPEGGVSPQVLQSSLPHPRPYHVVQHNHLAVQNGSVKN